MLSFPPCKINIGLHILRRRPDGFHDLELSFVAVPQICDILEITAAPQDSFLCTGIPVQGDPCRNLAVRARNLMRQTLQQRGDDLPPCRIHLHKIIPAQSGLGGGSSDAAYTLTALNEVFRSGLRRKEIEQMAAQLGSDCAFFTQTGPCMGYGTGSDLKPLKTNHNREFYIVIRIPEGLAVSTREAYQNCIPSQARPGLQTLLQGPVEEWKNTIENDFEKTLFPKYPVLGNLKEDFYKAGAVYASLSGSGSAVFGLFNPLEGRPLPKFSSPGTTLEGQISIP